MCEFARISVYTHGKPTPPALVNLLKDAPDQLVVLGKFTNNNSKIAVYYLSDSNSSN